MTDPDHYRQDATFQKEPAPAAAQKTSRFDAPGFARDFLTGCLALAAVAVIGLVLVPVLIIVFKLSALMVVPLGLLAIFVILTAFLGRIINLVRGRWPR
ncbi:MAG: hypothetical protein PVG78_07140 [Desulfobacterales bacterium]